MQLITGNTYPVKEKIKALGGKWNAAAAGWDVIDSVADECRKLVAEAPASMARAPRRQSRYRVTASARYGRCSCEDYPCCGH